MNPVELWTVLGVMGTASGTWLGVSALRRLIAIYKSKENGGYRLAAWILLIWPLTLLPIYVGICLLTIQAWDARHDVGWTVGRAIVIVFELFTVLWTVVLALATSVLRRK